MSNEPTDRDAALRAMIEAHLEQGLSPAASLRKLKQVLGFEEDASPYLADPDATALPLKPRE